MRWQFRVWKLEEKLLNKVCPEFLERIVQEEIGDINEAE
jgi:hypothetical protein